MTPSSWKMARCGMGERWKPVCGWEGFYEVSDHGRVKSLPRVIMRKNGVPCSVFGRVLKSAANRSGHLTVHLRRGGHGKTYYVHDLVLTAFISPRPQHMECCHWDDDPTNNNLSNLRWGTSSENSHDMVRNGNNPSSKRTHCPQGHSLTPPNLTRSKNPNRRGQCLSCARARAYLQRHETLKSEFQKISDSYYGKIMKDTR